MTSPSAAAYFALAERVSRMADLFEAEDAILAPALRVDGEGGEAIPDAHRLWLKRGKPNLFQDRIYGRTLFVMLNPSTADAAADDMTVRKCVGFAARLGSTAIGIVNLFTWRATDPTRLAHAPELNHADADIALLAGMEWLERAGAHKLNNTSRLIFAYGAPPWADVAVAGANLGNAWGRLRAAQADRILTLKATADELKLTPWCLGLTKTGWPRHPSRLPYHDDNAGEPEQGRVEPLPASHFLAQQGGPTP